MNKTNSRALELTIISGESLSLAGKRPIKKNAYVVIKTESSNDQTATAMDTDNGSYPSWSQKFFIDLPVHATFFTLEVRCKNGSGDHVVGSVRVPVSDFTRWYFPNNYLHFLSYRLRDRYGERNGIINFSVKVKSPDNVVGAGASMAYSSPARGWKYGGVSMNQGVSHGVVIGVPFGY
ncbi:hypothetical protein L1987_03333 [Smallanthus sonchifolius]|uniref:Uncharacterized protein n=1 Tax=Smallanthus sonchifolius TaxID=185202 RepID=A0ACB9KA74_9ASTR|nr:hypothetical protein L1987_03333 [Smallanthus sonchifolius]